MSEKLQVIYEKIDDLTPYKNNARKHEPKDIETIKNSIKTFGFNDPIGIWSDKKIIVEGHGRLMAAKELGLEEVPCIRLDHLTDEQRRAYALAHNQTAEMSEWDFEKLEIEFEGLADFDLEDFGFEVDFDEKDEDTEIIEDEVPEEVETRCKLGDIWQMGGAQAYMWR